MANDGPTSNSGNYRELFGRRFEVTECDADPEFVAKVARIHKDLALIPSDNFAQTTEAKSDSMTEVNYHVAGAIDLVSIESKQDDILNSQSDSSVGDVVETDGASISIPKKLKNKKKNKAKQKSKSSAPTEVKSNSSPTTKTLQGSKYANTDNDKYFEGEENLPSYEDAVGSSNDVGYSSRETIPADNQQGGYDAPDDGICQSHDSNLPLSVHDKINLLEYSEAEWKGDTLAAQQVKLGYSRIMEETGCGFVRKIRGDNYCGLRATCFQVLSQNLIVLPHFDEIQHIPHELLSCGCDWLTEWSFAGRLEVSSKEKVSKMIECLKCFGDALETSKSIKDENTRVEHFLKLFNSGDSYEIKLFEALKLLMLHAAVKLHDMKGKEEEPVLGMLLFARDTSNNPEELMKHHLNTVGDEGGLEQVEMCLLGYTLNLTIRVLRPSQAEQQDFISYFPADHGDDWDICNLIAEDDRHYNIIVN